MSEITFSRDPSDDIGFGTDKDVKASTPEVTPAAESLSTTTEPISATPKKDKASTAKTFNQLVKSLYRSTMMAQQKVEELHIKNFVTRYFDKDGKPNFVSIDLPTNDNDGTTSVSVDVPLLTLAHSNYLNIKELEMEFEVELGHFEDVDDDNMDHNMNHRIESQYEQSQQLQQPQPQLHRQSSQQEVQKNGNNQEAFTQLPSEYAKQYYQQYVPYFNQGSDDNSPTGVNKDELLTKLNQIIYLLEEQQDEKTNNVTEELVLYLFLGVFVIFVVDSFARAGKYTR